MPQIGIKISISKSIASSKTIGLKNNVYDDYINSGESLLQSSKIDIYGKFNDLVGEKMMGSLGNGGARNYWGIIGGEWRFSWGSYNQAATGGVADMDFHKFTLEGGKFYVDDIEKIDLSGLATFTDGNATPFWFYRIDNASDYSTRFTMTKAIIDDAIEFMPHNDGYWLKNGVPVCNRGEASNLYPLEVVQL